MGVCTFFCVSENRGVKEVASLSIFRFSLVAVTVSYKQLHIQATRVLNVIVKLKFCLCLSFYLSMYPFKVNILCGVLKSDHDCVL